MDGKFGDGRFSHRGVGGMRGLDGVGARRRGVVVSCVWCGAHATRLASSAGSRRFRAGERQLRGR